MAYKAIYNQEKQNDFKWILNELFGETGPLNDSIEKQASKHLEFFKDYKWPLDTLNSMNEKKAAPKMIENINQILNLDSEMQKYEILNISNDPCFNLEIPLDNNILYSGRPDAIIIPKGGYAGYSRIQVLRVMFEFKNIKTIDSKSTQPICEILAASLDAWHPVLLVVTDLNKFRMLVCRGNEIFEACITHSKVAFKIISYWLHIKCNQENVYRFSNTNIEDKTNLNQFNQSLKQCQEIAIKIKNLQFNNPVYIINYKDNYDKMFTPFSKDDEKHMNENEFTLTIHQIENAFFKTKLKLGLEGRSGRVYRIHIDKENVFALKLYCNDNVNKQILKEMQNEKIVYKHLNDKANKLKDKVRIFWPKLAYAGFLFDQAYYGICTSFIEGSCYSSSIKSNNIEKIIKSCVEALEQLHDYGVVHGDIRLSNFIIDEDSAKIIDFGFSKVFNRNNKSFREKAKAEMESRFK